MVLTVGHTGSDTTTGFVVDCWVITVPDVVGTVTIGGRPVSSGSSGSVVPLGGKLCVVTAGVVVIGGVVETRAVVVAPGVV